jgi:quercetin dioxygenase-like cupin family protein
MRKDSGSPGRIPRGPLLQKAGRCRMLPGPVIVAYPMERLMLKKLLLCAAIVAACVGGPSASYAQQPDPIKRTVVQRVDFPGDTMATLLVMIEVVPNGVVARHTHPGAEIGYIIDGAMDLVIGNQPPKTLKQGDTYMIPVGIPHSVIAGPGGAKLVATFVVDKEKPLASLAP